MPTDQATVLNKLCEELLDPDVYSRLQSLTAVPLNYDGLLEFDLALGGPDISRLTRNSLGCYHINDREIFRPLQYCAMHFKHGYDTENLAWSTRHIVHMSSLHIESLIKRIGKLWRLPLGSALRNEVVKRKLDSITWQQLTQFTEVYNDAKHYVGHDKDTHLFTVSDAVYAYVISRKLGMKLYPMANLSTDLRIFESVRAEEI